LADLKNTIVNIITKASSNPLLSRTVAKLGSKIYPPPFLRNDMEIMYGAWRGTSTVKGSDGRYLGEDNASPAFYCEPIPTEYNICKFGDSRDGKQYNMTALQDMMKLWPEVMSLIDRYRQYYKNEFKIDYKDLTIVDLFVFSKLLVATTAYLIRSRNFDFKNEHVPVELTTQTKLVAGVFMVGRKMIERGDTIFNDTEPADADLLYEYADKHHVLISPRDKDFACAGSIRKIIELIDVTIRGWHSKSTDQPPKELLKTVDETHKSAFEYGVKDLQMELTIKYAEVIIIEALLSSDSDSISDLHKKSILEHVKSTFPCEFTDPETLSGQKKNLLLVFNKLEYSPVEPKAGFEGSTTFKEFYLRYLEQITSFAFSQQNEINTLLDIQRLETLSTEKINKRLNIIP
jgi:hypothetical protein